MSTAEAALVAEIARLADGRAGDGCDPLPLARFEPVEFDPGTIDLVESHGATARPLDPADASGAGHDAQMLARVCPTSMIFVPSVNGLSHNIAEYTDPDDVAAGADVLLQTLLALAGARPPAATPGGRSGHRDRLAERPGPHGEQIGGAPGSSASALTDGDAACVGDRAPRGGGQHVGQ